MDEILSTAIDGFMIDPPPKASFSLLCDADGREIIKCPKCAAMVIEDECDVVGAEEGCVFCSECNGEFEVNCETRQVGRTAKFPSPKEEAK